MKALSIIDEVVGELEQDVNVTRIKRLILFACQETWENDATQLETINLRSLIQELCIRNGNLEDIEATFNRIVSKVNKKTEYTLVANQIISHIAKLFAEEEEQTEMESTISNSFGFQVQPYSQQQLNPLLPLESELNNGLGEADLLDVRQKIQQQTNPLRAKILIFSTLYHEFTFSDRDWSFLKTQELDRLLQQLLQACPTLGELESKLYSTANHITNSDDSAQAASAIVQALTPCYVKLQLSLNETSPSQDETYDQTHIATYAFDDNKEVEEGNSYFQDGEITMMSQRPNGNFYHHPGNTQQFLDLANTLPLLDSETNSKSDEDDDEDATSMLPPPQPAMPSSQVPEITESSDESSGLISFAFVNISDSIKQKLELEEDIKGLVTQGVNAVVSSMEDTLRDLEIALQKRVTNKSTEERLSLKYNALSDFIGSLQGVSAKFMEILSQLESAERERLNLQPRPTKTAEAQKSTSAAANPQRVLELAKQGHPKAIATLINQSLHPKGITAISMIKEGCLHIILESVQIPNQQVTAAFVERKLVSLKPKSIKTVRVHGRQSGNKTVAWTQEFDCQSN